MNPIRIGQRVEDDEEVRLERRDLETHMHLIGATGAGKTSALHTILRSLMLDTGPSRCAMFILDPMGNFSSDLLRFLAHPTFCTQEVRDRLLYIEPAEDSVIMPFNPIEHINRRNRYYRIMRTVDLVLRAWAAQEVREQPRLLQWTYKAFCTAAELKFPISLCQHLLHDDSPYHKVLLQRLPQQIKLQWEKILYASGNEATKLLESTRNRLDPFFRCETLRYMFGVQQGRFDCERLIRERRIVVVNLAGLQSVPNFICDTIGAMFVNEIFETATRMVTMGYYDDVAPTYVVLDEFQRYVSPDIQAALPTVRQMGLRLLLSHQSFAQLDREDMSLEQMIWEARTRLIFANYAKDADLLADEIAKITYDKRRIKEVRKTVRQLIVDYRKVWLESYSESETNSSQNSIMKSLSGGSSSSRTSTENPFGFGSETIGISSGRNEGETTGGGFARSRSHNRGESLLPVHKTFDEITNVVYDTFEEQALEWGQAIRRFRRGEAILQRPGETPVERIQVRYLKIKDTRELVEAQTELRQKSFESEFFISGDAARIEHDRCLQELLTERLGRIPTPGLPGANPPADDPFNS